MEAMTLLSLFIVALSYGATACMFTCMPLLSPIMLANDATRSASLRLLLPISAGRIAGYITLSIVAYAGAALIKNLIGDKILMGYLLGSVTVTLAFRLWYALESSCCTSSPKPPQNTFALFTTGVLLSMSLCAPVLSLMTLSATTPSLGWAILYGLVFGLGATLLWLLFFSVVMTSILKESLIHLQQYRNTIRRAAPLLLASVGIAIFNGWIHL
jgi:sulfite exporter TauE/SafE